MRTRTSCTRWEEFEEGYRLIWETHALRPISLGSASRSRWPLALMGYDSPEMKSPLELFVGVLVMMWSLVRTPTTAGKRCEVRGDHTLYVVLSPLSIWPLAPVSQMKHSNTLLPFPSAHSNSTFTQHASSTRARGPFRFPSLFVSL